MESGNVKKKKNKLIIVLISLVSVACLGIGVIVYNDYAIANSDNTVLSEAVLKSKDGSVESDIKFEDAYFILLKSYIEKMMEFNRSTYKTIHDKNVTESNKEDLISKTISFLTYSQSFDITPITERDKIMHENFIDMKYDAEKMAEYALQYIYKKENVYYSLHQDHFDNLRIHMGTMGDIEKKYYK